MREMNVGNLHPDVLDLLEDEEMMFFTKPYRHLYDTHERFHKPTFFNPRARVNTVQVVEEGRGKNKQMVKRVVPKTYTELVDQDTIFDLIIEEGVHRISALGPGGQGVREVERPPGGGEDRRHHGRARLPHRRGGVLRGRDRPRGRI